MSVPGARTIADPRTEVGYLENRLPLLLNAIVAAVLSGGWFAVSASVLSNVPAPGALGITLIILTDLGMVLLTVRLGGIVYAVPLGVASAVAIDWHLIPPTHESAVPTGSNGAAIAAYLVTGTLLGCLASVIRHRAAEAERVRRLLAEEQAAIRRVATFVARGVEPDEVFDAVTNELRELLELDTAVLLRADPDGRMSVVGWAGPRTHPSLIGQRLTLPESGDIGRLFDLRAQLTSTVSVAGRPWGMVVAGAGVERTIPPVSRIRIAEFTELIGLAIANSQARIELKASRTRIVTAADAARKRLERDLHDGVQQRLLGLALQARLTEAVSQDPQAKAGLATIGTQLGEVVDELRELSHGLHPAIVASGGLRPALATLGRRSPVPMELSYAGDGSVPEAIMVGCYYLVAEALTNAAKHADAQRVAVTVVVAIDDLTVTVSDDGRGGADLSAGTGLIGLQDRVEALGGSLQVSSPVGAGTTLVARLPLTHRPPAAPTVMASWSLAQAPSTPPATG